MYKYTLGICGMLNIILIVVTAIYYFTPAFYDILIIMSIAALIINLIMVICLLRIYRHKERTTPLLILEP
jgi:hypothetical protein